MDGAWHLSGTPHPYPYQSYLLCVLILEGIEIARMSSRYKSCDAQDICLSSSIGPVVGPIIHGVASRFYGLSYLASWDAYFPTIYDSHD